MTEVAARIPIIGIVGGIGSGKSAMSRAFETLGCVRIDADGIGHRILQNSEVRSALVERFGRKILDEEGQVNRKALACVAFDDDRSTADLNRIVGSRLWTKFINRVFKAASEPDVGCPAVVLDAALLYENNLDEICTAVVFVYAPDDVRRSRIEKHRGWDWAEVERREARQISLSRKREMADFVVINDQELDHLACEAARILAATQQRFNSPANKSTATPDHAKTMRKRLRQQ